MVEHLVYAVHDGFTQVLQARLGKDGDLQVLHHELLDNRLDYSLARQLNSLMGYTVHCLDGESEGRLLKLALERLFPGEVHGPFRREPA